MENIIYGKNNVTELLINNPNRVNKVFLLKVNHPDKKIDLIIDLAKKNRIPFSFVPKEKFVEIKDVSHQGVMANVSPVEYIELEDFLEKEKKGFRKVIILEGVEDPYNLGSIIRTSVCAGFDAIIIPKRRCSLVTSTVEKASAGAINSIDIIQVNSMQNAVTTLKNNSFWIIATDLSGDNNYYDIDYTDMNFAIIMGSEETGISSTIRKASDFKVKIPIMNEFDSLNVSNAASIIIYEAVRQILKGNKNEKV